MKLLTDLTWLQWLAITGPIGIFLSVYFYNLSKNKSIFKLYYHSIGTNIINPIYNKGVNTKITYNNQEFETFTITDVLIWNPGYKTIKPDDLQNGINIVFQKNNNTIIDSLILNHSDDLKISIKKRYSNRLNLSFSCFNRGDAVIIRLIHSNLSSDIFELDTKFIGEGYTRWRYINISDNSVVGGSHNTNISRRDSKHNWKVFLTYYYVSSSIAIPFFFIFNASSFVIMFTFLMITLQYEKVKAFMYRVPKSVRVLITESNKLID